MNAPPLIAVSPDRAISVKKNGAAADGTTDDTIAIQRALEESAQTKKPVYFPAGAYRTKRLTYKGQSLIGDGAGCTVITGYPGEDVFYAPDPSIGEEGSLGYLPEYVTISGLAIRVDDSETPAVGDLARRRPLWPIEGSWMANTHYRRGDYVTRKSAVLKALTTGVTGASPPINSSGVVVDGTVHWISTDDAQCFIGNAAFCFPQRDGAAERIGGVWNFCWRDVYISSTNDQMDRSRSCALFFQRAPYNCGFERCTLRFLRYGMMIVPPALSFSRVEYAPDCLAISDTSIFCVRPMTVFNSTHSVISNLQVYATNLGDRSLDLVEYNSLNRGDTADIVISGFYCEPNSATSGQLMQIHGSGHIVTGGSFKQANGPAYITWLADRSQVQNISIGGDGRSLRIYGNQNCFRGLLAPSPSTTVDDAGVGNLVEFSGSVSVTFDSERSVLRSNRSRPPLAIMSGEFINGFVETPFDNLDDLLIGGREFSWPGDVAKFTDPTLETGGYARTRGGTTSFANRLPLEIGRRVPAAQCRLYVKARAGSPGLQKFEISVSSRGTTTEQSTSWDLTQHWNTYQTDLDLRTALAGDHISIHLDKPPGIYPADYIDIAWIAIRPIAADVLVQKLELHPRVLVQTGRGSPEGKVIAPPGSIYLRTDGGSGSTLYIKESGQGATGWTGK